jgi:hypothetical protein
VVASSNEGDAASLRSKLLGPRHRGELVQAPTRLIKGLGFSRRRGLEQRGHRGEFVQAP